ELPFEADIVTKDGRRIPFDFGGTLLRDSEGKAIGFASVGRNITEQKEAERALRESEEKYRGLYDSIRDGIVMVDMDGNILDCNQAYLEMLGYSMDEVRRLTYQELTPEKWHEVEAGIVENQISKLGHSEPYEKEYIRKDGTVFPISIRAWLTSDREGNPTGMWGIVRDITDWKRAEEALEWDSGVNNALAELTGEMLLPFFSIEEIADMVLDNAKQLTGSPFGFVGYIDPKTGNLISSTMTRDVWDQCRVADKSVVFEKFGGLWGWVLNNRKPIVTNSPSEDPRSTGVPEGHIPIRRFLSAPAVIGDVLVGQIALANSERDYTDEDLAVVERLALLFAIATQRKRMEDAVRDAEAKYRELAETLPQVIFELNMEGVITYVNNVAYELFGYGPEDLERGMSAPEVIAGEDRERVAGTIYKMTTGQSRGDTGEYLAKRKDGSTFPAIVYTTLVTDQEGRPAWMRGILTDITDRKRAEEELQRVNAELEGFAHTVSHDLKGPLTVIALSDDTLLELLRAPMTDETKSDMEETTRMIQEGVVRATSLIDELLLLAKSGQVPEVVSDVNVGEVVKNILDEKARIIDERGVKVEVGEDLGQIRANRTHMYQVFSNLIGNALTYNDSEHPVISVSCLGDDETGAHRYLVKDNGSGIPPDQLEKLFLPFFKGESRGTGIGLSIVERIVHLYEGQIVAYNDKGACFKFTLKDFHS
ncbi:MAG: PAS domain S-box protein, partial [Actinobacteria bacterium]|nr:PAS domain S-box protein [Actinomycetota bacterium]